MKLACIGASYKFVRNVVSDLVLGGRFEDLQVVVTDIDRRALDIVVGACRALIAAGRSRIAISGTLDRKEALEGADFVLVAIGVGGLALWREETEVCLRHGMVHAVGDTIGPAALSKSLRTVPVMLAIARDMEALCPEAWLLNVTNPMATAVGAVAAHTRVKVLGLCDGSDEIRGLIAEVYGTERSRVSFDLVGVNHFAFTNCIRIDGREVTSTLYEDAQRSGARGLAGWRLGRELFRLLGGWLPLVEDRHLSEFFPYYVSATDGERPRFGHGPLDLANRARQRERLEQEHEALASGRVLPHAPDAYRNEDVHAVLCSLRCGDQGRVVVNVPNRGCCPQLAAGAVLEIPAMLSRDAVCPVTVGPGTLPPHIASILGNLGVIYDYTVQAAVAADMAKAREALLLDPFLQNRDILTVVPRLVEELFRINAQYLRNRDWRTAE